MSCFGNGYVLLFLVKDFFFHLKYLSVWWADINSKIILYNNSNGETGNTSCKGQGEYVLHSECPDISTLLK